MRWLDFKYGSNPLPRRHGGPRQRRDAVAAYLAGGFLGGLLFLALCLPGCEARASLAQSPRAAAEPTNAPMAKAVTISIPPALAAMSALAAPAPQPALAETIEAVAAATNNGVVITWSADTNHAAYFIFSKSYGLTPPANPPTNSLTGWCYVGAVTNTNSASMAAARASGLPITNLFWKIVKVRIP